MFSNYTCYIQLVLSNHEPPITQQLWLWYWFATQPPDHLNHLAPTTLYDICSLSSPHLQYRSRCRPLKFLRRPSWFFEIRYFFTCARSAVSSLTDVLDAEHCFNFSDIFDAYRTHSLTSTIGHFDRMPNFSRLEHLFVERQF